MENSNKWSAAAYNGLLLSLVTVIITVLSSAFPNQHNAFVSIILWIVRITASLYILYYFMRSYSNGKEEVSYKESFSYGTIICLFSSIVCAGVSYLCMTLIFPDTIDTMMENIGKIMAQQNASAEDEDSIMRIVPHLPELSLIFGFIYMTIFGVIASAIIASYTKKVNPFPTEQNKEE